MNMTHEFNGMSEHDPLDLLVEEYAQRCRRGEPPPIEEYAAGHPAHADQLRRLLPAVTFLERGKSSEVASQTEPHQGSEWAISESAPAIRQLGENRIIRELGRGGMGIVYEAVQEPLGRPVAVKILIRHAHADATSRQRFFREAQVVAKLRHPRIVPIHAIGEQDGLPYFVMALIDGTGLDRLQSDPATMPPIGSAERARRVAELGLQAAEALAYAHGEGVAHRDVKPANLLLDTAGTLWLADFGLAKLAGDLSLTGTGDMPGTLRYLAPECFHAEADERSDIYSLGLTLYELAAGQPGFPEPNRTRLLHQIATQAPPAPRQLVPTLPGDLETIILKAMAREPAARYESAAALAEDLGRFLDDRPILARRSTALERLVRWGRRNPVVAALAATSLILAVIASYFLQFYLEASSSFPGVGPGPPHHGAPPQPGPPGPGRFDSRPPPRHPPGRPDFHRHGFGAAPTPEGPPPEGRRPPDR